LFAFWALSLSCQDFLDSLKQPFPPSQEWEAEALGVLGCQKSGCWDEPRCVGSGAQPPESRYGDGPFPAARRTSRTRQRVPQPTGGRLLAPVAEHEGFACSQLCEERCSPRPSGFMGVGAEKWRVGCLTGVLQFNSIKHAGCLLCSFICQVPKKSQ